MAQRIRWTPFALSDLEMIHEHISKDSPQNARIVINEIRERIRTLRDFPLRGHVAGDLGGNELREMSAYGHRIVYRVKDNTVEMLGVIHGSRDLPALWRREKRPGHGETPGE